MKCCGVSLATFYATEVKKFLTVLGEKLSLAFEETKELVLPVFDCLVNLGHSQCQAFSAAFPISDIPVQAFQSGMEIFAEVCKSENNRVSGSVVEFAQLFSLAKKNRRGLPLVYRAFIFAKTIPLTSAEGERIFSKMKIVKNRLRSTMGDERLDYLMLMMSEKDMVTKINLNPLVGKWKVVKQRHLKV